MGILSNKSKGLYYPLPCPSIADSVEIALPLGKRLAIFVPLSFRRCPSRRRVILAPASKPYNQYRKRKRLSLRIKHRFPHVNHVLERVPTAEFVRERNTQVRTHLGLEDDTRRRQVLDRDGFNLVPEAIATDAQWYDFLMHIEHSSLAITLFIQHLINHEDRQIKQSAEREQTGSAPGGTKTHEKGRGQRTSCSTCAAVIGVLGLSKVITTTNLDVFLLTAVSLVERWPPSLDLCKGLGLSPRRLLTHSRPMRQNRLLLFLRRCCGWCWCLPSAATCPSHPFSEPSMEHESSLSRILRLLK